MSPGIMAVAVNAVANASRVAISERQILAMLATGEGSGHLVRALFGDCSFETLDRLGAEHGIGRSTIRSAYAHAKEMHAAYNDGLERDAI